MSRSASRRADRVARARHRESAAAWAPFLAVMVFSVYLMQRAFAELARAVGRPWPRGVLYVVDGPLAPHVVLTIVWPLVLAMGCWTCRRLADRRRLLMSSFTAEGEASVGTRCAAMRGDELAGRWNRALWSMFAAGPGVALGLHLTAGLQYLAGLAVLGLAPGSEVSTAWPTHRAVLAMLGVAGAGAAGLWGARAFFNSTKTLRKAAAHEDGLAA